MGVTGTHAISLCKDWEDSIPINCPWHTNTTSVFAAFIAVTTAKATRHCRVPGLLPIRKQGSQARLLDQGQQGGALRAREQKDLPKEIRPEEGQ